MIGAVGHDTRHREQVCQSIRPEAGHAFTSQPPTHPSSGRSHHRHGRSQVVDRWQPRVGDQEEGRKEQPDHDGRDERRVEGVEVASTPVTRGNPWRDRWRRRHEGRPTRRGPTGGCPVPRGIRTARPPHAPSPSHPTLPVCADMRAPASRAPACPVRVPAMPRSYPIPPAPSTRWVTPGGVHRRARRLPPSLPRSSPPSHPHRPPLARRRSTPTAARAYKPAYAGTRPHRLSRAV